MGLFDTSADKYDRFMGRYSSKLAPALADAAGVTAGMRALDVGCGPGVLTSVLSATLGEDHVAAIDPAEKFFEECRRLHPGADVRRGDAEELPWADDEFDAALACLVVAFMSDADAGTREMARVTKPGGTVAACMWDLAGGGMTMLKIFWEAYEAVAPGSKRAERRVGTRPGDIAGLLSRAGCEDILDGSLTVSVDHETFDDFWTPFTLGVGPAGSALTEMSEEDQTSIKEKCRAALPEAPFSLDATAWFARGTVPG